MLGVKKGVYFPSLLGVIANQFEDPMKVEIEYKGKKFSTVIRGVNVENLAVEYDNRLIAEMIESGAAERLKISMSQGRLYNFRSEDNYYYPVADPTPFLHILAPFYKKEIADTNIFA